MEIEAGDADAGIIRPFDDVDYPEEVRRLAVTLTCDQNSLVQQHRSLPGCASRSARSLHEHGRHRGGPRGDHRLPCYGKSRASRQHAPVRRGVSGVADAAKALGVPVIAGNVSLYNESDLGAIPPSPMISMLGKLGDASEAIPSRFQAKDSILLLVGKRSDECGGSVYLSTLGLHSHRIPRPDLTCLLAAGQVLQELARSRSVRSCHDISEGGLAIAVSEMAIRSGIGCVLVPATQLSDDAYLFGETPGFVIEVDTTELEEVVSRFASRGVECLTVGHTTAEPLLGYGETLVQLEQAHHAWTHGLREKIG